MGPIFTAPLFLLPLSFHKPKANLKWKKEDQEEGSDLSAAEYLSVIHLVRPWYQNANVCRIELSAAKDLMKSHNLIKVRLL